MHAVTYFFPTWPRGRKWPTATATGVTDEGSATLTDRGVHQLDWKSLPLKMERKQLGTPGDRNGIILSFKFPN